MIELNTRKEVEVIDMTSYVEKAVKDSSIEQGICLIYALHTTTGIVVNEAEPGLIQDMEKLMASLVPKGPDTSMLGLIAMLMLIYRRCS
jgi:secondary thiamine-phosphate synthase enzyme